MNNLILRDTNFHPMTLSKKNIKELDFLSNIGILKYNLHTKCFYWTAESDQFFKGINKIRNPKNFWLLGLFFTRFYFFIIGLIILSLSGKYYNYDIIDFIFFIKNLTQELKLK